MRLPATLLLALSTATLSGRLAAQDSTRVRPDSTARPDTTPAPAPQPAAAPALPFDFSGVLYANYQYGGLKGNRVQNRFDVDRAYLTLRGGAGEHMSWRVTLDVFQQRDTTNSAYYRGWTTRFKYAFAQYDVIRGVQADEWKANVRLGMLQTVVIDQEEQFWQRGLSPVAVDQLGFFASSDLGAAATITFPNRIGEVYATVVNGPGYTSREVDRFKDFAGRLTLTPLANTYGFFRTLAISGWYSKGESASNFAGRRRGTVPAVTSGLEKDRYGVLAALRDPRITLGAHWARRIDETDRADTTRDVVPTVSSRTGQVLSLFTIAKPLAFVQSAPNWPLSVVLRADEFKPDVDASPYQRFYIAGLQYALSNKATLTFDFQDQEPKHGSGVADQKTWFVHLIANF